MGEVEDALQEAWLRIRDRDPGSVDNMQAWLTTVVGRVCLNLLRSRRTRREVFTDFHVPDPVVAFCDDVDPEQQALLADSVGMALLVVLDTLSPAERLAFVLHDVFGVPFAQIATVLERSEAAAQQLASRARRQLRGSSEPDRDLVRQHEIVEAKPLRSGSQHRGCLTCMHIAYIAITITAALANGYAACLNFAGAESVKVVADRVQVSQKWMIPLGSLLAAGTTGLLIGFAMPLLGTAAAIGLILYFISAISAHIRAQDPGLGGAAFFLALAVGALAANLAYHNHL